MISPEFFYGFAAHYRDRFPYLTRHGIRMDAHCFDEYRTYKMGGEL